MILATKRLLNICFNFGKSCFSKNPPKSAAGVIISMMVFMSILFEQDILVHRNY